jgi:hypothetical protein
MKRVVADYNPSGPLEQAIYKLRLSREIVTFALMGKVNITGVICPWSFWVHREIQPLDVLWNSKTEGLGPANLLRDVIETVIFLITVDCSRIGLNRLNVSGRLATAA